MQSSVINTEQKENLYLSSPTSCEKAHGVISTARLMHANSQDVYEKGLHFVLICHFLWRRVWTHE